MLQLTCILSSATEITVVGEVMMEVGCRREGSVHNLISAMERDISGSVSNFGVREETTVIRLEDLIERIKCSADRC